jgi:hypothetical protein
MKRINSLKRLIPLLMLFLAINIVFPTFPGTIQTFSSDSLPIHLTGEEMGPNIQNVFINPENITTNTELIDIRASITDSDGISWVRVFACLTDEFGVQVLCLPPQEMTLQQGDIWEAEVRLLFAKAVGDNIGFNITAQDNLGDISIHYTIRVVTNTPSAENGTTSLDTSTKETSYGIWGSFLGLILAAILFTRIKHRKKKGESLRIKSA